MKFEKCDFEKCENMRDLNNRQVRHPAPVKVQIVCYLDLGLFDVVK